MADGAGVDAEQGADGLHGQVQVLAQAEGDQVVGEVDPAVAVGAVPVPDGVDAAAAAAGVVALLAAGAGRDVQGCGQGVQVAGVHAGQRGVVQDGLGAAAGTLRFRLWFRGGSGSGQDGVVPLAADGAAVQDAVLEVPHPRVADLPALGISGVIQDGGALQALAGDGRGDAGHGVFGRHQGAGVPGAGDVAEQPVLDLVPLGRAGPMPLFVSCKLSFREPAAAGG